MARVFLRLDEFKGRAPLPKTCVICGAVRAKLRKVELTYSTRSHFAIAAGEGATIYTFKGKLPLCGDHREYFENSSQATLYLGLSGCGTFLLGALLAGLSMLLPANARVALAIPAGLLLGFAALGVPIILTIVNAMRVRADSPLTDGVWLAGVSQDFENDLHDKPSKRQEEEDHDEVDVVDELDEVDDDPPPRRSKKRKEVE